MGHPRQCCSYLPRHSEPVISHQYRVYHSDKRNVHTQHRQPPRIIYSKRWLRVVKAPPRTRAPTTEMDTWSLWHAHQSCGPGISPGIFCLELLSCCYSCGSQHRELGGTHFLCRDDTFHGVLPNVGKGRLHNPLGETEQI